MGAFEGPMHLYLVQHGEARSEAEDPERPLTERGREEAARVARFLARHGARPAAIRHSGKRRAEQTAAIFAEALLGDAGAIQAVSGINPKDPVEPVAEPLSNEAAGSVMLVGHLPSLSRLASLLLAGDAERTIVRFRQGGAVCLVRSESGPGAQWSLAWMVTPDLLV
jgi:phosphohistidine phosphatase